MSLFPKAALSCILLALALVSATKLVDTRAELLVDRSLTRALTAYAAARGLNGVISVAQGTEIAVQPAGFGVTFTPGEILDPVNDLIERFSWIMLLASTSIGIQKLLLELSQWPYFAIGVSVLLIASSIALWVRNTKSTKLATALRRIVVVGLILRFSVPLLAIGGELVFATFLDDNYTVAANDIQRTTTQVEELNTVNEATNSHEGESSWFSDSLNQAKSFMKSFDIAERIKQYETAAEAAISATLSLIVIFLFQTVLVPLGFVFAVKWFAARSLGTS